MKKILTFLLPSVVLIVFVLLTAPALGPAPELNLPSAPPPSGRQGTAARADRHEDLTARRNDQLLRLADPATGRLPVDIHRLEREFAAGMPRGGDKALNINWSFRGPNNVGGRTRALAVDVSDPTFGTLLAGGVSGGMWRSVDDGASWTLTTGSSQIHHVSALVQDTRPGHRNIWYYGTGEGEGGSASWPTNEFYVHPGDGIFKSTDGGVSWSVLPSTAGSDPQVFDSAWQIVWRVAVDVSETTADEIYAATWGGIYRSTDGGGTWALVLGDPVTPAHYADIVISPTGVVYATLSYDGDQHGAFRSTDGINWTEITPPGYTDYDRIIMAMAPGNENVVWFLVANSGYGIPDAALFRYQYLSGSGAGAGGWWQDRSAQLASLPGTYGAANYETQGSYCQMIAVNPLDTETVYLGGVYLYRSTDGFQNSGNTTLIGGWGYSVHHADLHWLVFRPGSSTIAYTGSDGGVHQTQNAGAATVSWTSRNLGYNTSQFYTVAIDENLADSPVVIGGTQDNGTLFGVQDLPTASWTEALAGDGGYCAVASAAGPVGTYYMSYQQNFGVFRMQLDNTTGAVLGMAQVDPPGAGTSLWLKPFILDPLDPAQMYLAADESLWRNSDLAGIPDGSKSATALNWGVLSQAPAGQVISALAASRSSSRPRFLYFGTAAGQLYRLADPSTAPLGSAPERLDVGAGFPAGAYLSSIAIHHYFPERLLVAFSNYNIVNIFASEDGGLSWTAVEGNLGGANSPSVRAVAWLPTLVEDYCFAATSTGLYATTTLDGGATVWQQEAAVELGNIPVDMLAVRPADRLVVAGTHGKGVLRGLRDVNAVPEETVPAVVRLDQNVPNPFNPTTTIGFGMARGGRVTLAIHDVAGRRVRTLLDEYRNAGDHQVVWNGTDDDGRPAASGTYLCRFRSLDQDVTRAMTLLR